MTETATKPAGQGNTDTGTGETGGGTPAPDKTTATAAADTKTAAPAGADADAGKKTTDPSKEPGRKAGDTPKAPEKYSLTAPEGGSVTDDDIASVAAIAKEQGWTNEEAQARLDWMADGIAAQSAKWLTATEADPDYGGDKLAESQKRARAIVNRVRPEGHPRREALLRILDSTGYGNHIEVLSFLADLGKLGAEDSPGQTGSGGGARPRDAAAVLYGPDKTT